MEVKVYFNGVGYRLVKISCMSCGEFICFQLIFSYDDKLPSTLLCSNCKNSLPF